MVGINKTANEFAAIQRGGHQQQYSVVGTNNDESAWWVPTSAAGQIKDGQPGASYWTLPVLGKYNAKWWWYWQDTQKGHMISQGTDVLHRIEDTSVGAARTGLGPH